MFRPLNLHRLTDALAITLAAERIWKARPLQRKRVTQTMATPVITPVVVPPPAPAPAVIPVTNPAHASHPIWQILLRIFQLGALAAPAMAAPFVDTKTATIISQESQVASAILGGFDSTTAAGQ